MKKTGSSIDKIQQAYSVVNTNVTEVLLASSFEIIFEQLKRYTFIVENSDPIDWKLFCKRRNNMRLMGEKLYIDRSIPFEDEKSDEEKKKEAEDEEKENIQEEERRVKALTEGSSTDRIVEAVQKQTQKEFNKLSSKYDDKIILKLLRLLEVFTAIALKSKEIKQFVLQVTRPIQVISLAHLLLN